MKIELWAIEKPIPYARNARKIPQSAIDKVAASIQEFGFRQPIVVDKNRVVLAGHTRLLAAKKLGLKKVPVHVASNLTVAQAKAYRLADNRTNNETIWDCELLGLELKELKVDEFSLELTAFDAHELNAFLAQADKPLGTPVSGSPEENWKDMPEFHQEDLTSEVKIIVHFATASDKNQFGQLIGQALTDNTRSIWFPEAEIGQTDGKRYAAGSEG
jgi:hypothetical protein